MKTGERTIARNSKGLIRAGNRSGTASGKQAALPAPAAGATICERCGAMWARRTWRRMRPISRARLARARWTICPACRQQATGMAFGRVRLRGDYLRDADADIRRRIANVAARAGFTQPQRRVIAIERVPGGLDVLTTSQKLAHRIVTELQKLFRGRAEYRWSDRDGSLDVIWTRDR